MPGNADEDDEDIGAPEGLLPKGSNKEGAAASNPRKRFVLQVK